jgi:hypothetical protein
MSNYKTNLLEILDRPDIDVPTSANIFVYDKGKVIARSFDSDTGDWGRFVDRLYVTEERKYCMGTVWLADGKVLELVDNEVWTIKDYNQDLQKLDTAALSTWGSRKDLALSRGCVWTDDEKVAVIMVADALRVGDVPGLKQIALLPSHCRSNSVLPKQRAVLPDPGVFIEDGDCSRVDPVAEANVLTLMRLMVSASGNMSEPSVSMKDYWDASTMPLVRAAAQALLDFKAAVEF